MIELHAASFVFGILAGVGLAIMVAGVVVIILMLKQIKPYIQPTSKQGD